MINTINTIFIYGFYHTRGHVCRKESVKQDYVYVRIEMNLDNLVLNFTHVQILQIYVT